MLPSPLIVNTPLSSSDHVQLPVVPLDAPTVETVFSAAITRQGRAAMPINKVKIAMIDKILFFIMNLLNYFVKPYLTLIK